MKKIIVTGASGFIGSACITLLLKKNYEIHAISTKKRSYDTNYNLLHWYRIDLNDSEQVQRFCEEIKAEYLLHLAWDVSDKQYNSNQHYNWVKIGINLVDAFAKYGGKRVVISGTCAEYDLEKEYCSEHNTPLKPQSAYGVSKHVLQLMIDSYARNNNISYAWGRIFFAYGPNENPNSVVSYIIRNLKDNQFVEIKQGNSVRDYIYIEDIADAFITILESDIEGAVNISTDTPIAIKDIALKIASHFKNEHLIQFGDKGSTTHSCIVGVDSRLHKELGWKPSITIEEGLKNTIHHLLNEG